ncbi:MAG: hypothetical protein Q8880_01120 [Bacteroidota bacterium]|nr:hypothetical protein [Bacteroidota bacterium]
MSYRINSFIAFALLIIMFITSCEVYNPSEIIPSYIKIDKVSFQTTSYTQGSNSSNITDAWVYIDDQTIGSFELPAKIPVLYEGKHSIKIYPGIKINGISSTRGIYPFYTDTVMTANLKKDSILYIKPSFTYSNAKFEWIESFDNGGISMTKVTSASDTIITKNTTETDKVYGGTYCGQIALTTDKSKFECITLNSYSLSAGTPVYLELDFKCEQEFTVGLVSEDGTAYDVLTLNPTSSWKKVYVNLSNAVSSLTGNNKFYVYFQATLTTGLTTSNIYLDNIKLLHYNYSSK